MVSFAYLRLLILLLLVLIAALTHPSQAFLMVCSAYRLNKQGDSRQPCHIPFSILNQSIVPCRVINVASWPTHRFIRRKVRWPATSICLKAFHSFFVCLFVFYDPHSQRLCRSQWNRDRCFSGILYHPLWSRECWQFDLWLFLLL